VRVPGSHSGNTVTVTVIPAKAGTQARNARALHGRFQTSPSVQRKLEPILITVNVTVSVTVIPANAGTQARNGWALHGDGSKPHRQSSESWNHRHRHPGEDRNPGP